MKDWKNIRIWRISAISLLLCLVVFICYIPIFSNGFLDSWDDQWMVMNVYTGSGWTWENLLAIFTQSHKGQYSHTFQIAEATRTEASGGWTFDAGLQLWFLNGKVQKTGPSNSYTVKYKCCRPKGDVIDCPYEGC